MKKEYQFQNCNADTKEEVWENLFKKIGHDSKKWRFDVVNIKQWNKKLEMKKLGLESIIYFGKYNGQKIEEILKKDKSYIKWVIENTKTEFRKEVLERVAL